MSDQAKQDRGLESQNQTSAETFAAAATGTNSASLQERRINQVMAAISPDCSPHDHVIGQLAAVETMAENVPRNGIEAMLAGQMVATNDAAMECFKRASMARMYPQSDDRDIRHAIKLIGLFNRQVDALAKVRASAQFANYWGLQGSEFPVAPPPTPEDRQRGLEKVIEAVTAKMAKAHE